MTGLVYHSKKQSSFSVKSLENCDNPLKQRFLTSHERIQLYKADLRFTNIIAAQLCLCCSLLRLSENKRDMFRKIMYILTFQKHSNIVNVAHPLLL